MGVMGILNVAHVPLYALGAIVGWWAIDEAGFPLAVAFAAAPLAGVLVGAVMYVAVFGPLSRRAGGDGGHSAESPLIASIGLSLVLTHLLLEVTGGDTGSFPESGLRSYVFVPFDGLRITGPQLLIVTLTVLAVGATVVLVRYTRAGKNMRSIAYDRGISAAVGINVERTLLLFFAFSSGLASLAGVLLGYANNEVYFAMGHNLLLLGVAAVVLGGFGSIPGTVLGALVVATGQVVSGVYLSAGLRDAFPFLLIVLMMLVRPNGLFPIAKAESV